MNSLIYVLVYLLGILISSFAQILLKTSAGKKYNNRVFEYINPLVIFSYLIFFSATFCTIYAYRAIPLSLGPILAASEYIFVAILSKLVLKEKISIKKLTGLITIALGIIMYSIKFLYAEKCL